jgi:hypothetical protein
LIETLSFSKIVSLNPKIGSFLINFTYLWFDWVPCMFVPTIPTKTFVGWGTNLNFSNNFTPSDARDIYSP